MADNWKYYIKHWRDYKKYIKAALIITVIAAVLIFGVNGEKETDRQMNNSPGYVSESEKNTADSDAKQSDDKPAPGTKMYVDISGCVVNPDIYQVDEGMRLFDVINLAGGLTEDADRNGFKQAEQVTDGEKIVIPSKDGEITSYSQGSGSTGQGGKININSADSAALQQIPGVGPSTAGKIIDYREQNGRFKSKEDIKNVSGIGDKTYDKLEDMITV